MKNILTLFVNKVKRVPKVKLWKFNRDIGIIIFYENNKCFHTSNSFDFSGAISHPPSKTFNTTFSVSQLLVSAFKNVISVN